MEKDQRLTPLPNIGVDLQTITQDYPTTYAPVYDDENFDEKHSIRQYISVVYKRLPLILALTILTTACAAFYMYRQPSMYSATTAMIIEPRKPKPQAGGAVNLNFGNDVNYYNTQLQLLQNPELMKSVVVELGLHHQPNLFNAQNKGTLETIKSVFSRDKSGENTNISLPNLTQNGSDGSSQNKDDSPQAALTPEEKSRAENYAGMLLSGLKVDQVPTTNLVNITVQSISPELSAKVADKVAESFIAQDVRLETQGAKQTYEELSKSIEDLKGTISSQEIELIKLKGLADLPLGESKEGGSLSAGILQQLSTSLLSAKDERSKIEARYNAAVKASSSPDQGISLPDTVQNPYAQRMLQLNAERKAKLQEVIRDYDNRIKIAETEKAQLLVKYTNDNPKVQVKEAEIANLTENKAKTEKETTALIKSDEVKIQNDAVNSTLVSLKSQLGAAQIRENQLSAAFDREAAKAKINGEQETKLTTLERELLTNRGILDTYSQQQKQRELEISSTKPDNLKISSHAVTPNAPVGPQRTRNIIVAFLISLAAGIGLAFLMDYLDDSVKTSDDVGRHLGLPTLALIPHQNLVDKRRRKDLALTGDGAMPGSMTLVTLQDQRSPMAEAYRHLRTSLLFSSAGKPPQTILITSSQPSEGKTTTAINTALTLAQSNTDVVIIDCDLRRPRLHTHFGLDNTHGLTNYLSGERNPENLLKPYTGLPKLKVITSGPIPPNPAELLSSAEMKNLLQFLKGKYKHIIIDSPPAISFTDASILSTQVDGVVLVAMAGKSSLHLMRRFKQRLGSIGARIYGVVLNGIKTYSLDYEYGSTYGYYSAAEDDSTPLMEEIQSIHDTKD